MDLDFESSSSDDDEEEVRSPAQAKHDSDYDSDSESEGEEELAVVPNGDDDYESEIDVDPEEEAAAGSDDKLELGSDNKQEIVEENTTAQMHTNKSYIAREGEDMEAVVARLFPLLSLWNSKEDLKDVIGTYGLKFGFKICGNGWKFTCNKAGATRNRRDPDVPEHKRRNGNRHLKVGCKMFLNFSYVVTLKGGKRDTTGPVRVTATNFSHTGTCIPSPNQYA
jgi:hypothetical protein